MCICGGIRGEDLRMNGWLERLKTKLEPLLTLSDPRPGISAYHDMPYAIFHYPPEDEFSLRQELSFLVTRLQAKGKKVTQISLAELLRQAMVAELSPSQLVEAEQAVGVDAAVETAHKIISEYRPLADLVAAAMPSNVNPLRDIVFIVRAGALFPMYRTSSLLEQLRGKVTAPSVLFFPGQLDGAAGLRFMGVLDAEHNYRPRIF
jgi:hypothetical protein